MTLTKFLLTLTLLCAVLIAQASRLFSILGFQANFLLIALAILVFFTGDSPKTLFFLGILFAVFLGIVFLVLPFSFLEIAILETCALLLALVKKFLTGNEFLDFSLLLISLSIAFFIGLQILQGNPLLSFALVPEILTNITLGAAAWYLIKFRL